MKYWASNFAIIPVEGDLSVAGPGIAPEKEWILPGIASWMLCGEHPRRLFLQLLLGSLALVATIPYVQASSPKPVPSENIAPYHQQLNPEVAGISVFRHFGISGSAPSATTTLRHRKTIKPKHRNTTTRLLSRSNGAILAHQTTSIAKPFPAARNGVAISAPLPEARDIKKMTNHFQICTQGYSAQPGIPIPASGLFIRPLASMGLKVNKGYFVHPLNPRQRGTFPPIRRCVFPRWRGLGGGCQI